MKKFLLIYLFPISLLASSYYGLTTYEDEERFNNLIKEIRCPKCTSGSLASSNAPVSEDLKFKIAQLINEKKSNEEIKKFVSQRYGNQSLYDPGLSNETYILWFAPFIFLLIASIVFIMRSKR
jgi:cytochrome c-type biogenesis protein CcmH